MFTFAGPINWFLSHNAWRLPARLSYGMFLFHYPLMFSLNAAMVAPIYFSVGSFVSITIFYVRMSKIYADTFQIFVYAYNFFCCNIIIDVNNLIIIKCYSYHCNQMIYYFITFLFADQHFNIICILLSDV